MLVPTSCCALGQVALRRIAILRQFLKATKNDTAREGGDPVGDSEWLGECRDDVDGLTG